MPFDPQAYGPHVAAILALDGDGERLMPLVQSGCSAPEARSRLQAVTARALFPQSYAPEAAFAGLYLYFGCWTEAHEIAQDVSTPEGSYWHGIVHRQEPDAANSGYWFRQVGAHPDFPWRWPRLPGPRGGTRSNSSSSARAPCPGRWSCIAPSGSCCSIIAQLRRPDDARRKIMNLLRSFFGGQSVADEIAAIHRQRDELAGLDDETLRRRFQETSELQTTVAVVAAVARARARPEMFDVQLQGALALARGRIVEMQTGEGKTLACRPAVAWYARVGPAAST